MPEVFNLKLWFSQQPQSQQQQQQVHVQPALQQPQQCSDRKLHEIWKDINGQSSTTTGAGTTYSCFCDATISRGRFDENSIVYFACPLRTCSKRLTTVAELLFQQHEQQEQQQQNNNYAIVSEVAKKRLSHHPGDSWFCSACQEFYVKSRCNVK
jgi:hypothetical protein